MADSPRIEELKRRVQQDPASIAFAALADEYRRAGRFHDAVETCRAGLLRHPAYLSARVTLGRALLEIGEFDDAEAELQQVLRTAPENLAAIRALAEIHHRRGDVPDRVPDLPASELKDAPAPADTPPTAVSTVVPFAAPAPTPAPPPPAPALSDRTESKGPALSERSESKGVVPELERFLAAIQRARRELDSGITTGR